MSRIGKKPIPVAAGVDVTLNGDHVKVKGPKGELALTCHPAMALNWDAEGRVITVARPDDVRQNRALHGLTRALIANMVEGVQKPFEKRLEIQGVGYQASLQGKTVALQVGFANTIKLPIPEGIVCEIPQPTQIIVRGIDKGVVGQFAANIRRVRPPEPYKGKGIRYFGEQVRRKAGKALAGK
ncbi:MAG: 50S ribosomal protein L6 [Planctomyces sp.]|nr:50S ribosomal protein L6 [Planctomyces sp.]